jgi:hypothetical protein
MPTKLLLAIGLVAACGIGAGAMVTTANAAATKALRATAWKIGRQQDWDTLRDAEYLAVTRLQADALTTVDPDMAAKAKTVVPVATLRPTAGE